MLASDAPLCVDRRRALLGSGRGSVALATRTLSVACVCWGLAGVAA